jgi:hypothetical protein
MFSGEAPYEPRLVRYCLLSGYSNALVQELGREIRSIWPGDRVELGVKHKGPEITGIAKRFEDRAVEVPSEVHCALDTITETQPDDEVSDVSCCNQSRHGYSSGAMGFNGCLPLARSQSSSNSAKCARLHSCTFRKRR